MMRARLLETVIPSPRQLRLWPCMSCPNGVVVLCISEFEDYLEVLYGGEFFFIEKTSVVIYDRTSGRHYSDA